MTDYERADQECRTIYNRMKQVESQMQSITDSAELSKQKKRFSILSAMYREALERRESARPPCEKKWKAPRHRVTYYTNDGGTAWDWLERIRCTCANIEGNTVQWADLDVEENNQKERLVLAIRRGYTICTPRQQEMLDLMLQGQSVTEIGRQLGVDKSTVSKTLSRAKRKMRTVEESMRWSEQLPAPGIIDISRREVAERILSSLSDLQAVYLYLYYGERLTFQSISNLLGRAEGVAYHGVYRACKCIRAAYNCETGGALIGMEALEATLYEILQSYVDDAIIQQRTMQTAAKNQNEHTKWTEKRYRNKTITSMIWKPNITPRSKEESRLLNAVEETVVRRGGTMLDWLLRLMRYAKDEVFKSIDTYCEWQRQHGSATPERGQNGRFSKHCIAVLGGDGHPRGASTAHQAGA